MAQELILNLIKERDAGGVKEYLISCPESAKHELYSNLDIVIKLIEFACIHNDKEIILNMKSDGVDFTKSEIYGGPVHYAYLYHKPNIVKHFLDAGWYDAAALNEFLCTRFQESIRNMGDIDLMQLMVRDYYEYDIRFLEYRTDTLHLACEMHNIELVKFLLENKYVDINRIDSNGYTALHIIAGYNSKLWEIEKIEVRVKSDSEVALEKERNIEILKYLLHNGAEVNVLDNQGRTALHLACIDKNFEAVSFLLDFNSEVNIRNKYGVTPLEFACTVGVPNTALVHLLLEKGANVHPLQNHIYSLSTNGNREIIKLLCQYNMEISALGDPMIDGELQKIKNEIEKEAAARGYRTKVALSEAEREAMYHDSKNVLDDTDDGVPLTDTSYGPDVPLEEADAAGLANETSNSNDEENNDHQNVHKYNPDNFSIDLSGVLEGLDTSDDLLD